MEDTPQKKEIESVILDLVPEMITNSVSSHSHMGGDSPQIAGNFLLNAPQVALTTATGGSLSTGGAYNLTAADNTILTNAITRIADIESKLQALGLIS